MELNTIQQKGKWSEISDTLNENFAKVNAETQRIELASRKNKGYFATASELTTKVPTALDGDIAYVGAKYPYNIYRWVDGAWVDSGEKGGEEVNNITNVTNIAGSIVNNPDDEDLVENNGVLKLKDRDTSKGMGYVILRTDKTFAEQVIQPNTIYEIRYDFDLDRAEVEIPENCVLKFEGGCLKNGILLGNKTQINANKHLHIFQNVKCTGTYSNTYGSIRWFGAKPSTDVVNKTDSTNEIKKCIESFENVLIPVGCYYVTETLNISDTKHIYMDGQHDGQSLSSLITSNSCGILFTDCDISILNVSYTMGHTSTFKFIGGGLDVSLSSNYNSSVLLISTENNSQIWGCYINTYIRGAQALAQNNKGCGIELCGTKSAGFITMIRIGGKINNLGIGIKVTSNAEGWITDLEHYGEIKGCYNSMLIEGLEHSRLSGSYQPAPYWSVKNNGMAAIDIKKSALIVVDGRIWDIGVNADGKYTSNYSVSFDSESYWNTLTPFYERNALCQPNINLLQSIYEFYNKSKGAGYTETCNILPSVYHNIAYNISEGFNIVDAALLTKREGITYITRTDDNANPKDLSVTIDIVLELTKQINLIGFSILAGDAMPQTAKAQALDAGGNIIYEETISLGYNIRCTNQGASFFFAKHESYAYQIKTIRLIFEGYIGAVWREIKIYNVFAKAVGAYSSYLDSNGGELNGTFTRNGLYLANGTAQNIRYYPRAIAGATIYNIEKKKMVLYNGETWTNLDGSAVD